MAISSGRVTIGSNPVTVENGFELKCCTTVSIPISPTDPLYAVAASGVRVDIDYLVTGR